MAHVQHYLCNIYGHISRKDVDFDFIQSLYISKISLEPNPHDELM